MKRFFKFFVWLLVVAVFVGTLVYLYRNSRPEQRIYEVLGAEVADIEKSTVLTGKIEPRDEIEIKPQISGIIAEINVEAGDIVREGDVIAKIKVIPDDSQLNSARTRLENAKLTLAQARSQYERTKMLFDRSLVSRDEFEEAETAFLKAKEEEASALDALSIVKDGVSKYNAQSSNTLVRATITGQILEIPVKVGSSVIQANTMNDGTTIAKVADMGKLIFKGKVDETEVGLLSQGMPMVITVGALPDIEFPGSIEYISPKSNEENGANTFELKASIVVGDTVNLRAGYSANAAVVLRQAAGALSVPESAVEWSGDSTFVYVLTSDNPQAFDRTPVVTGVSDGVNIQIVSGLAEGAKVRGNLIEND